MGLAQYLAGLAQYLGISHVILSSSSQAVRLKVPGGHISGVRIKYDSPLWQLDAWHCTAIAFGFCAQHKTGLSFDSCHDSHTLAPRFLCSIVT